MKTDYTATDRRFIHPDTLPYYCNTNAHLLTTTPRAFVLEFPGLGGGSCLGGCMEQGPYNSPLAGFLAEQGILLVYTFPGPWSWMSRGAVRMINALVDALREAYGFTSDTPWAVMGGSMGGTGALIYAASHGGDSAAPRRCVWRIVPAWICRIAMPARPRSRARFFARWRITKCPLRTR